MEANEVGGTEEKCIGDVEEARGCDLDLPSLASTPIAALIVLDLPARVDPLPHASLYLSFWRHRRMVSMAEEEEILIEVYTVQVVYGDDYAVLNFARRKKWVLRGVVGYSGGVGSRVSRKDDETEVSGLGLAWRAEAEPQRDETEGGTE
ncbi:unnamed protein product [Linum trigynum]|uniref:Uncharacterized protein n=1 Tax=Linum trigynum TaxID=586398 RepID=A0AAV2F4N0_9ROSI